MVVREVKTIIDTPPKRRLMFSFIAYFPIISILAGAPLPFPSLFSPTAEQMAFLNLISLLVTLVGTIIGVGFYLEKRQNSKIDRLEEQIDESVLAVKQDLKDIYTTMKEMEARICDIVNGRIKGESENTDLKVSKAKELADAKIQAIENTQRDMRKDIQQMERQYHNSNRFTRSNRQDEVEDNNGNIT